MSAHVGNEGERRQYKYLNEKEYPSLFKPLHEFTYYVLPKVAAADVLLTDSSGYWTFVQLSCAHCCLNCIVSRT